MRCTGTQIFVRGVSQVEHLDSNSLSFIVFFVPEITLWEEEIHLWNVLNCSHEQLNVAAHHINKIYKFPSLHLFKHQWDKGFKVITVRNSSTISGEVHSNLNILNKQIDLLRNCGRNKRSPSSSKVHNCNCKILTVRRTSLEILKYWKPIPSPPGVDKNDEDLCPYDAWNELAHTWKFLTSFLQIQVSTK